MKRRRFSEEQIIGILKEHEAGVSIADFCRKHGVGDASIYGWKARFCGMDVSEAKRLRALEDENGKLKRMLALYRICRQIPVGQGTPCSTTWR
jgi:putative transposase